MQKLEPWKAQIITFLGTMILARACLTLVHYTNHSAPLWPASGLGIFMAYLYGARVLPAILLGSFLGVTNFNPADFALDFFACVGNIVEAWVGRSLLLRIREQKHFGLFAEGFSLIITAACASFFSALIGVGVWVIGSRLPPDAFTQVLITWWTGNLVGILILTPCLISFVEKPFQLQQITFKVVSKLSFLLLVTFAASYFIFFFEDGRSFIFSLFLLFILWNGLLSQQSGKYLTVLVSAAAMISIYYSYGPFSPNHFTANLALLEVFLCTFSLTAMILSEFYTSRFARMPLIVVMSGWILAGTLFYYLCSDQNLKDQERFSFLIRDTENQIRFRLWGTEGALWSGATLFAASQDVDHDEWQSFVTSLEVSHRYEGVIGLGAIQLPQSAPQALEKNFFEPEKYREFARKIKDFIAQPQILGPFFSEYRVQSGIEEKPLFFLNLAMYWNQGKGLPKVSRGWLYAVFSPVDFFNSFKTEISREIEFFVFSREKNAPELLVYSSENRLPQNMILSNLRYEKLTHLSIAQKDWIVAWRKSNFFVSSYDATVAWFAAIGALFSLMVATLIYVLQNLESRATELALSMTHQIRKEQEERQKVELSMQEHRQKLIETSKMSSLGEMAGGIAHEINNPLTVINAKAELIARLAKEDIVDRSRLTAAAQKIEETVQRIAKIIRGLRIFARSAESDPMLPNCLQPIIENTLELCQERFRYRNIDLKVGSIPEVEVVCRETQITQVLVNLLNNSFDAVISLAEKWVHLDFELKGSYLQIAVTDSGSGLPEEIASKVMQPFFTTKEVGKGTGLGLSISKGIIEEHGGILWLDRSSAHTRFVVSLYVTTHSNL